MAKFLREFSRQDLSTGLHLDYYRYWNSLLRGRQMPARADLDPALVPPHLLPWFTMLEVHGRPPRYRVRLSGTGVDENLGFNLTGHWADEYPYSNGLMARFDWLVEHCTPYYAEDRLLFASQEQKFYSCMVCPFSEDGTNVSMILATNDYF